MNSIRRPVDGLEVPAPVSIATTGLAGLAILVALFALVYQPTFVKLARYWGENDVYSYAFLIPLISGLSLWSLRSRLTGVAAEPSFGAGLPTLAGGLLMLLVGRLSNTNLLEELSIVVSLCGLTLLIFGRRIFRIVLFPLAYLLAMVPIWDKFTSGLHPVFQLYSARVGVSIVQALGIPVLREGVLIHLPNVTLEVAQACSGINYLIAVICVGYPITHMLMKRWPKRLMILCASALIALLSNALRVAIVCLFAYYELRGADGDVHGPYAIFRSLLISGIGFAVLFALIFRFADRDIASTGHHDAMPPSSSKPLELHPVAWVLAAVLFASYGAFINTHRITAVPLQTTLERVPERIGDWTTSRAASFASNLESVPFDDRLSRNYATDDGTEANLFIGYYRSQEQGKELAGFALRSALARQDDSKYMHAGGKVTDYLTAEGSRTFHVTYWYVLNGSVVSDDRLAKLYTAWDSLFRGRTNGGIVVVKTDARPNDSLDIARRRDQEFVAGVMAISKSSLLD